MSSNISPKKTQQAGPVNQLHEKVQKEAAKGTTQKRRERRKNRKAEVAEAPTDITPSSSQPPPTPTTIIDPTVSRGKNLPISERPKGDEAPTGINPSTSQLPALLPPASHVPASTPLIPTPISTTIVDLPAGITRSISQPPALLPPASHVPASTPLIPTPISTTIVGPPASHENDQPISEKTKEAEAQTGITPSSSQPSALVPPAGHLPASNPLVPSPTSTTIINAPASDENDLPISEKAKGAEASAEITTSPSKPPPTPNTIINQSAPGRDGLPISEKGKGAETPTGITLSSLKPPKEGEDKKAEGDEMRTGITPSASQPPIFVPPACHVPASTPLIPPPIPTTIVDPSASHGNDLPISGSAPAPPQSFAFRPITTAVSQSPLVSLPLPLIIEPKTFDFEPATTNITQESLRPPPHKTFTEMEVSLQLTTTKAEIRANADRELSQLTTKLEKSKIESTASKKELEATKIDLEKSKTELARVVKKLKLAQETLQGLDTPQGATRARIEETATSLECMKMELNFERTTRQGLEAELAATREALVVFQNNKLSNGRALALLLLLLALIFILWSIFLFWYIWTRMQLPLAVVSRIDSVHMYPETSEAWMMMDKFGWFGD